eukprot:GFKZ01005884.1.p1 GENE.GFKZ01005884.1~~GFKZ01005884.1.p1  ORF type:complete len:284 (-),score=26.54 GFKZ01005884.1:437-1288(-)
MTRQRVLVAALVSAVFVPLVSGQVSCTVTKPLQETVFISAFRHSYISQFGSGHGFNLRDHAVRTFALAEFETTSNRGDNCEQRIAYTENLCKQCVRRLAWRANQRLFPGGRDEQRLFVNDIRKRMCEDKETCERRRNTRPPETAEPPVVGPLTAVFASDVGASTLAAYKFALVAVDGWTGLTYVAEDLMGGRSAVDGVFLEMDTGGAKDVTFFECVKNMFEEKVGVANVAASAMVQNCWGDGPGIGGFNQGCADWILGGEVCQGLKAAGCTPMGTVLRSQCVL